MKRFGFTLAVCAVLAFANGVLGGEDKTNEILQVILDLSDGSRLVGTPAVESVPVQTSYARMNVPLNRISDMTMAADHESASFELRNGDKLTGVVNLGPLGLTTLFGKVTVGLEHVRALRVSLSGGAFAREGLVLWNRLDSEHDVTQSCVGPGGKFNAGRFVEGRFGKGVELSMKEQYGVTFPAEIVPGPDGCIEFWARLAGFPADIRQPGGAWPGLIAAGDDNGPVAFLMHFCSNDGGSAGGVCFQVAGNGGTGLFGSWSYAKAIGSDTAEGWHHYALVWAADGISGVDNGKRKAAVFVDGKLNTGFWNGAGSSLTIPKTARFGFLAHQGTEGGSVVFDNLKIWSRAKTDFSDRDKETP